MRVRTRLTACAALTACAVAVPAGAAVAKSAHTASTSPTIGYVYSNDNTATANTIAGFARHLDGSLTALPGSPFSAGGVGAGHGNTSQGSIVSADGGRFILAVDNGSNQISVLKVGSGGALTQVGSPVSSGGTNPVSIGVSGSLVYVANAAPGAPNVTGFRLSFFGALSPIANSTVNLAADAQPDDVVINSTGTNLVVPDVAQSVIYSYAIGSNGLLTAAANSPYTAQGAGPFGSEFDPTDPTWLYVSNAHNGTALGTVSAYTAGADGSLTSIGSSPFADSQTAPCWLTITPNGKYVFAVNTATPSVSSYAINSDGSLTLIGSFPIKETPNPKPTDAVVSGNFLYVVAGGSGDVIAFRILSGGFLSELSSSPTALPQGATASGITAAL
jgi:6-phosphogluconolactonase (cycloisomerase 2 family)